MGDYMKKCLHCGEVCGDNVLICPKCGALTDNYVENKEYMDVYHINHGKKIRNYKLILWFLIGLILPYVGFLIAWIMYDSERDRAKAIMFGAIVSTIISTFLSYILMWFLPEEAPPGDDDNQSSGGQQIKTLIDIYRSL